MRIFRGLRYLPILSLDVAVGSVVGTLFIGEYLGVTVPSTVIIVLFLSVWLIYTLDHLLDVHGAVTEPIFARHRFHWKYSITMWGVWSFTAIALLSLVFRIPRIILVPGLVLAIGVLIYFVSTRWANPERIFHKEAIAALIYASGVFLPPLVLANELPITVWILFGQFSSLAFLNLLMFALYEHSIDKKEGFRSLVLTIGIQRTTRLFWSIATLVFFSLAVGFILVKAEADWLIVETIVLLMTLSLMGLVHWRTRFYRNGLYRILGDAVFLLPAIALLV